MDGSARDSARSCRYLREQNQRRRRSATLKLTAPLVEDVADAADQTPTAIEERGWVSGVRPPVERTLAGASVGLATLLATAIVLTSTVAAAPSGAADGAGPVITTYAGGPGEGEATNVGHVPSSIATVGPLTYVADDENAVVRALDLATGQYRVVAGNGLHGSTGDGGPALDARLRPPLAVAAGADGSLYISEIEQNRVRRVDPSGVIDGFAGTGTRGFAGDGGLARNAELDDPRAMTVDTAGNLLIAEAGNDRVRKVGTSGRITTLAGTGTEGDGADTGLATLTQLRDPMGIAAGAGGSVYIADTGNQKVRRVDANGLITKVAGSPGGSEYDDGDGGPATLAHLYSPLGLAVRGGELFIGDYGKLRRVDASGTITTMFEGTLESYGRLGTTFHLAVTTDGRVLVADRNLRQVLRLDGFGYTVVAGNGRDGAGGDGGPATAAQMSQPNGLAVDGSGNVYIADEGDHEVRKVSPGGMITKVAGTGEAGYTGDGGPGTAASLNWPSGVAADEMGNVYIADHGNFVVRRVDPAGVITTVAGTKWWTPWRDGAPATDAYIGGPNTVAVGRQGDLFIAAPGWIYKMDAAGTIRRFAGNGRQDSTGDGGPATSASLYNPFGLAVDDEGNVFVADVDNRTVRKIDTAGIITRVAGSGYGLGTPNSDLAVETELHIPRGVAVDGGGNVYVADVDEVRRVDPSGVISTVAGGGEDVPGDGGPATSAHIVATAVAVDVSGNLYLSDVGTHRIRRVAGGGAATRPAAVVRSFGWNGAGALGTGDLSDRLGPVAVGGVGDGLKVAAGGYHSLAVTGDGTVKGWGYNGYGQLGTGGTSSSSRPVTVPGLAATAVAAGALHSVALRGDGTVRAWGWNGLGQVGDGTGVDRLSPVVVPGLAGVTAVAAGAFHSLALRHDGTVWAWGWNPAGGLGDGTRTQRPSPVKVLGISNVVAVAAGAYHSVALTADGAVWAWGWNYFGQLGNGTTVDRLTPVRASGVPSASIAAGAYHSLAARRDGTAAAWGWNGLGQLGDGTVVNRLSPVAVHGLSGATAVAAGWYHSVAVRGSTSMATWGWNAYGQLGDGTTVDRHEPVTPVGDPPVGSVAGGGLHTVALG